MAYKKNPIDCKLSTFGTEDAKAKASEDLEKVDPEPVVGRRLIDDVLGNETKDDEDDDRQENPR